MFGLCVSVLVTYILHLENILFSVRFVTKKCHRRRALCGVRVAVATMCTRNVSRVGAAAKPTVVVSRACTVAQSGTKRRAQRAQKGITTEAKRDTSIWAPSSLECRQKEVSVVCEKL